MGTLAAVADATLLYEVVGSATTAVMVLPRRAWVALTRGGTDGDVSAWRCGVRL